MPLQPPSPDFLAKAPGPPVKSATADADTDAGPAGRRSVRRSVRRSGWRLPVGVTGLVMLMLAVLFGVPELV